MNLAGLWQNSYYRRFNPLTPWTAGMDVRRLVGTAKHDFDDARATSFYRYQLPAFHDLYGVDFDRITDEQARDLDARIFDNYQDRALALPGRHRAGQHRADVQRPLLGPARLHNRYPFEVLVFNVTTLLDGFHPSEFKQPSDDPYRFAKKHGLKVDSLDDYLAVLDRLFREAKDAGRGLPEDDAGLPADAPLRGRPARSAPTSVFGPTARPSLTRGRGQGLRGLHHVAAGRAERRSTSCRSRSTPGTASSRGPTRCSWST